MDILYTVNNKYIDIMLASLQSIICNGQLSNIRLHIVTSDCTDQDIDKIKRFLEGNENIQTYFYRLEDNPIESFGIPNWRGSQIANARIFYPRIIKAEHSDVENLLYIDSDTVTVGDLNPLTAYDNNPINACLDDSLKVYTQDTLGLDRYYNSGVLYINVDKFLDLEIENRVKEFLKTSNLSLSFPDQDLLNLTLKDELNTMPSRFNLSPYTHLFKGVEGKVFYNPSIRQVPYEELKIEVQNRTILHSYGLFNIKPWFKNNINPYTDVFMEYLHMVDKDFEMEELSNLKKKVTKSPELFKALLMLKSYLPKTLEEKARAKSLSLQKAITKR